MFREEVYNLFYQSTTQTSSCQIYQHLVEATRSHCLIVADVITVFGTLACAFIFVEEASIDCPCKVDKALSVKEVGSEGNTSHQHFTQ